MRVALLTTVCVAVAWLVIDVLGDLGPGWRVRIDAPLTEPGHDHRLSAYLRVVEGHLTSSTSDAALRDRLGRLVDRRLARRYGLGRHDPEAVRADRPRAARRPRRTRRVACPPPRSTVTSAASRSSEPCRHRRSRRPVSSPVAC